MASVNTCNEGCRTPYRLKRGWCPKHYMRVLAHGSPVKRRPYQPRDQPLRRKLTYRGWDVTESGCWEWKGTRKDEGYGTLAHRGHTLNVHRVAYETWVGPIPDGLLIRHKCDNPPCINPEHLETGTKRQNTQDMMDRGRRPATRGDLNPRAAILLRDCEMMYVDSQDTLLTRQMLSDLYGVCASTVTRHISKDCTH